MAGMIYEVRAESRGRVHSFGSFRDRGEAETQLTTSIAQVTKAGGKNDRYWIEEINTDGLFEIPSEKTPRMRFHTNVTRVEGTAGHWDTTKVSIWDESLLSDDTISSPTREAPKVPGNEIIVGSYERNYRMMGTFEPFRQGDRNFALIAPHYTATSVMDLATGEIIASEEPQGNGFCPVGFYVPDWWDVNDGSMLPGSLYWDEGDEWPTGDFGFVWGCHWGDDSSWKVQYLDLSKITEGIITREERFGYVQLATHHDLEPKNFIRLFKEGTHETVSFDVEETFLLDDGKRLDPLE